MATKTMKIRRADTCVQCNASLEAGTEAEWDASAKTVRCLACVTGVGSPEEQPDTAGGSARREYERRSARELAKKEQAVAEDAKWRQAVKEQRPFLGRIVTALTPVPQITPESQTTRAWKVGTEGEERVAEVLDPVEGIEVLHDRLMPGSRQANIDHIVVGPAGVYVIDAKKYAGAIELRDVGGLFKVDERLYVDGRNQTKLVDGVLGQVEAVRSILNDSHAEIPVRGVLCFIGCEWGWIMRTKTLKGVTALWPTKLPDHVKAEGPHADRIADVAAILRLRLKQAS